MRIAYVCADRGVPVFGHKGASVHVQEVLRHLRRHGATVELFARRRGGAAPDDLATLPIHRLPKRSGGERAEKERFDLESNDAIRAILGARGSFDLIYERHSLWSYAGMEHARDAGIPGLLEVNAPLLEEQRRYRGLVHDREAEEAVARAYGAASALLAVSDDLARGLERSRGRSGSVHVIPNGVDPDRFSPDLTPARPGPPGSFTIGFVSTLKPWHGGADLLEAFADVHRTRPGTRLLVVGDGPERSDLQSRAAAQGVSRDVDFCGAVAPTDIPGLLASMDVAVAPYPPADDFYFSPLKLFEYMAASRAIVATAIGQIDRLIEDGVTGLLYAPGDTAALAAALRRLRDDPALRSRLGAAARRAVMRDHTWRAVTERILDIATAVGAAPALPRQVL